MRGGGNDLAPRLVFVVLGANRLNPVSSACYHRTRTLRLGESWTTVSNACSAGAEDRAECVRQGIDSIKGAWHKVTETYNREGDSEGGKSGRPFVFGDEPCFLDFAVAGRLKYILDGLLPSEVETLKNLEGGRLVRLVENLERYFIY